MRPDVDGVAPVRCFPLSAPESWISFCDERGREVHSLGDPAALDEESKRILASELARREFIPQIRRIHAISAGAEPTTWEVTTDRGDTRFVLPSEDHVRRLGDGALITDEHGIRYRIGEIRSLDKASRKLLQRYL